MGRARDPDAQWLKGQLRQQVRRDPKRISEAVNRLIAQRGYANVQLDNQWNDIWLKAAGTLAGKTRIGKFSRGVLEIVVENSSVLQGLTFQKRKLLSSMNELAPHLQLKDLRFRVGQIG